jgi:predicted Zn-dependent protease
VAAQQRARKLDPKNGAFAADLCRAHLEEKDAGKAAGECRAAVELEPKNPLAHYELMKVLVAKGDCAEAKSELGRFKGLGVKPEAQKQADAIVASCKKR